MSFLIGDVRFRTVWSWFGEEQLEFDLEEVRVRLDRAAMEALEEYGWSVMGAKEGSPTP